MAVAVEMPKLDNTLGNTVEECLIARWVKQEGQADTGFQLIPR